MAEKRPQTSRIIRATAYLLGVLILFGGTAAGCAEIAKYVEGPCHSNCTTGGDGGAGAGVGGLGGGGGGGDGGE